MSSRDVHNLLALLVTSYSRTGRQIKIEAYANFGVHQLTPSNYVWKENNGATHYFLVKSLSLPIYRDSYRTVVIVYSSLYELWGSVFNGIDESFKGLSSLELEKWKLWSLFSPLGDSEEALIDTLGRMAAELVLA